ncbi:hypothetical protein JXO59_02935 [candidate division KSB1 bacterium]|nr:hypothetical protein [candidate division KSB1 bacterium]
MLLSRLLTSSIVSFFGVCLILLSLSDTLESFAKDAGDILLPDFQINTDAGISWNIYSNLLELSEAIP